MNLIRIIILLILTSNICNAQTLPRYVKKNDTTYIEMSIEQGREVDKCFKLNRLYLKKIDIKDSIIVGLEKIDSNNNIIIKKLEIDNKKKDNKIKCLSRSTIILITSTIIFIII